MDDRSSDATPAIADALAEGDPRVRVVHVRELPAGWLGKHHALHLGTEIARGEWLLFCDADVRMAPDALRKAVALAVSRGLDHLPVLPRMITPGFWHEVATRAFGASYLAVLDAAKLGEPGSDRFAGVGAFNLVRAAAWRRTEGFRALRMEIADDVGMGLLLNRAGATTGLAIGTGAVEIEWYPSLKAMARGLEKNLFGVFGHFSFLRAGVRLLLLWAVALAPVAAALAPVTAVRLLGLAALVPMALAAWRSKRLHHAHLLPALLVIPGAFILGYMVLASAYRTWREGGVRWRGTFYPLRALREGQRVKL